MKHPLSEDLLMIMLMGVGFGSVLLLARWLHRRWKVPAIHTRKLIHVAVGAICIWTPYTFSNHWVVLGSSTVFFSLLILLRKRRSLPSLHQGHLDSWGDLLLPVAIYLNFLFLQYSGYHPATYLPLLILTFGDPAAFYGGYFSRQKKKSLIGLTTFVVVSFLISIGFLLGYTSLGIEMILVLAFGSALVGGLVEFWTRGGWDNLTIPLSVAVVILVFLKF